MATLKRIILEMGTGTDLHGQDYTKAAIRAVQDALRHSSLALFGSLNIDPATMQVDLRLAAQEPEKIDLSAVSATFPHGSVTPVAVKGGLNVPDADGKDAAVIVNAGIIVRIPL